MQFTEETIVFRTEEMGSFNTKEEAEAAIINDVCERISEKLKSLDNDPLTALKHKQHVAVVECLAGTLPDIHQLNAFITAHEID